MFPTTPWRAARRRLGTTVVAAALVAVSACSSDVSSGSFTDPNSTSVEQVRLVQQPWEDLVVENHITKAVLDALGYQVQIDELSVPLGAQALAQEQADAYLGNWWPSQKPTFQKYFDDKAVKKVGTILTGTRYAPAVPDYVAKEYGIRSFEDLAENAEVFDHKFIGIEPGTPGNQFILDAIDTDAYGLGDWSLVQSSTAGMLAEVTRAVSKEEPVVFLGWSPHWMNLEWGLHYLEDPQHVWPGAGQINVVVRDGLTEDDPNLARFFSQIKVEEDAASKFILDVGKNKQDPEDVADQWIADNLDTVEIWLEGVETLDGKPAAETVNRELGS